MVEAVVNGCYLNDTMAMAEQWLEEVDQFTVSLAASYIKHKLLIVLLYYEYTL